MRFVAIILSLTLSISFAHAEFVTEDFEYMKKFLNSIQQRSFDAEREYCGYLGYNEKNELEATEPTKGEENSCFADDPPASLILIASYHTHGAFSIEADSELPSSNDMVADIAEKVDGFIATPGGRIWFIDNIKKIANMVCDRDCILSDPKFDGSLLDPVKKSYTVESLKKREADSGSYADEDVAPQNEAKPLTTSNIRISDSTLTDIDFNFIREFLNTIQQLSFDNEREYCGYFGIDENDELIATKAHKGEENGCTPDATPEDMLLFASYHTHGAFSVEADSERPSLNDMQSDIEEEVHGIVATPGGRIWYIDSELEFATMECDRDCILSDPKFDESLLDPVKKSYTLKQLQEVEAD